MKSELLIKTETIQLTEDKTGFWLYDETRGMNLAIKAKTERAAFLQALDYYQDRTAELERQLKTLKNAADAFIAAVLPEDDD